MQGRCRGQDISVGAGHNHSLMSDGPHLGSRLDPPLCIKDQPGASGQCVEPRPHKLCHLEGHEPLPVTHTDLAKSRGGTRCSEREDCTQRRGQSSAWDTEPTSL